MKPLIGAKITALGTYVPPKLLTNEDLEKLRRVKPWLIRAVEKPIARL